MNHPISDAEHAINLLKIDGRIPTSALLASLGVDYAREMQRGEIESVSVTALRLYEVGPVRWVGSRCSQMRPGWSHDEGDYSAIAGPSCSHPITERLDGVRVCPDCGASLVAS